MQISSQMHFVDSDFYFFPPQRERGGRGEEGEGCKEKIVQERRRRYPAFANTIDSGDVRARCLGVFSTRQTWILSGLIIGSSGIQLPSRIHRTRNRAGSEQKGRSRGVREGWKAMARCNWYRWKAGEGGGGEIWFNVPMTLLSEADNRHGRHKGAVVKFQLTKGDPKNRAESSSCNRGSRLFFYSFLFIYLFIPRKRWKYCSVFEEERKRRLEKKFRKIESTNEIFANSSPCDVKKEYVQHDALLPLLYEEYINICKLRDKNRDLKLSCL